MCGRLIHLTCFVVVLSLALASPVSAELVAHWKFDEGSGDIAHDASGNGNDGTFVGDPQWAAGKTGGALEFNGSSDYIEVPFSESLKVINQGDFTIAAWFMLNEIPSEYKTVFQQGDDAAGGPGRTWLLVHQSNDIRSSLGGAATGSGVGIEGGIWYHAAVVVTEGGTDDSVQLYVNGEPAGDPRQDSMEDSQGVFYIGAHKGLGNIWDGLIDELRIYSHALSEAELLKLVVGPQASKPNPADGSIHEATWTSLSWVPGRDAVTHDVYIGESFEDVNSGAEGTFQGNQGATNLVVGFPGFPIPDGLVPGTTYYWRIDEVNDADPNSPWKGNVWSFSTPPKTAYFPDPADGAEFVDPNAIFTWTPGYGAKLHTVYLGDNYDDVSNAVGGMPLGTPSYDPGTLEAEKVLYWRVDEFDGVETHKGDIWSFTTPGAV
ncbi:MAG: LamG domain-containing protein, partial [Planctomycetota bacterium]|nr:LamG domain-containing protein [Planctomycetota bacterium]